MFIKGLKVLLEKDYILKIYVVQQTNFILWVDVLMKLVSLLLSIKCLSTVSKISVMKMSDLRL